MAWQLDDLVRDIATQIKEKRCVAFLGAAANKSAEDYQGLPLGWELAARYFDELGWSRKKHDALKKLIAQLEFDPDVLEDLCLAIYEQLGNQLDTDSILNLMRQHLLGSFAEAKTAELLSSLGFGLQQEGDLAKLTLAAEVRWGRPAMFRILAKAIRDGNLLPSLLLQTLANLPVEVIITTNFDRLMEAALQAAQKETKVVIHPRDGFPEAQIVNLQIAEFFGEAEADNRVLLYKLHGTFSHTNPDDNPQEHENKLVITEEDYIRFLTTVNREDKGIPPVIKSRLQTSTVLFCGYSLEDWDFRVLHKSLIEPLDRDRTERSYAIQKNPPEFWVRYWLSKGVEIIDTDIYHFTNLLKNAYEPL